MESNKPKTIEEYIISCPDPARKRLSEMYDLIKSLVPDAAESLKWGMPAFSYKRILVTFAGFKHHVGFYPTPSVIEAFAKELKDYHSAKGSVQFPLDAPLPTSLIKKMVAYRVKESKDEDAKWRSEMK